MLTMHNTHHLHASFQSEWPESLVGSSIAWEEDALECESSSKMVKCLNINSGIIGHADASHALKQGLDEIALVRLAGRAWTSAEALENGGVGDALAIALSRVNLDFGSVNPASEQSLLKVFLVQTCTASSIKQC